MSIEVVRRVKAALLAQGRDLSGPCGAGLITYTVAWQPEIRAQGFGLIKSSGNGCPNTPHGKCRADTLMLKDGRVWDILGKAEDNEGDTSDPHAYNLPMWDPTGPQPPDNWREPFDPGVLPSEPPVVGVPDPSGPVGETPAVVTTPDLVFAAESLSTLLARTAGLEEKFSSLERQLKALKIEGHVTILGQKASVKLKVVE